MKLMQCMRRCISAVCAVAFFLVPGCSSQRNTIAKPAFEASDEWKNAEVSRTIRAPLSFLSLDGNHLMVEMRDVEVQEDQTDAEAVIQALINGPIDTRTMRSILSTSVRLVSVEISGRVANIELSTNYMYYREDEMLKVRVALANTLCQLLDVDYINVYVDGMEPGYLGMPLGACEATQLDLALYCDQVIQQQRNITDDDDYEERRIITLYTADATESYLIANPQEAVIRTTISGETVERNYLRTVVELALEDPLFDGVSLIGDPAIQPDAENKKMAMLVLDGRPENEALAYGALVYAITGFVCNISYVNIVVRENGTYTPVTELEGLKLTGDSLLRRSEFSSLIGNNATLYLPDEDKGRTKAVEACLPQRKSEDAESILQELFNGSQTRAPLLEGLDGSIVNSAKLCGNVAVVDLSADFDEACQQLTDQQEYLVVYSIVNTLTEIREIDEVQFLIDGQQIEYLKCTNISGPLLRNPGLIA